MNKTLHAMRHAATTRHILYPKVWDVYPKAWDVHPKVWDVHTKAWDIKILPKKREFLREEKAILAVGLKLYLKSLSCVCRRCRVKKIRLFTVPKGSDSLSAISRYLKPDTCIAKGTRYSRGKAFTARRISLVS